MKKTLLIIGGIIVVGALILGYKINSDLNELEEAFHSDHNLKDSSFVLLKSELSPDRQFKFFEYQFDNGGFGYSRVFWSVIKNDSTVTDLEMGLLPDGYKTLSWTDSSELIIEKWEPYYFKEREIELSDNNTINNVTIKLRK